MNYDSVYPERFLFLRRFIKNPGRVGSIAPSSESLAKRMVRKTEVEACSSIVELGAGTGVFTKYIDKYKPTHCSFHVFEKDENFTECLKMKYPHLAIYPEAACIEELTSGGDIKNPELIISGLPFAIFETSLRNKILDGVCSTLPKGGKFITFQYSLDLLSDLKKRFGKVEMDFVFFNLPPAVIYRCTKE